MARSEDFQFEANPYLIPMNFDQRSFPFWLQMWQQTQPDLSLDTSQATGLSSLLGGGGIVQQPTTTTPGRPTTPGGPPPGTVVNPADPGGPSNSGPVPDPLRTLGELIGQQLLPTTPVPSGPPPTGPPDPSIYSPWPLDENGDPIDPRRPIYSPPEGASPGKGAPAGR